jgi:hypothetical protein
MYFTTDLGERCRIGPDWTVRSYGMEWADRTKGLVWVTLEFANGIGADVKLPFVDGQLLTEKIDQIEIVAPVPERKLLGWSVTFQSLVGKVKWLYAGKDKLMFALDFFNIRRLEYLEACWLCSQSAGAWNDRDAPQIFW